MSAENVALVRSLQLGCDVDVATVLNDPDARSRLREQAARLYEPCVQVTMRLPGMGPVAYSGLDGLGDAWRDWLSHWESYRVETEDVIADGERVVVVHRSYGRPRPGVPEIARRRATIWTVRDGRIVSVDFNVPYAEALEALAPAS